MATRGGTALVSLSWLSESNPEDRAAMPENSRVAVPATPSCMTRHPDVGREAAQHADAALAIRLLSWISRGCEHTEVARDHDVQREAPCRCGGEGSPT